MNFIVNFFTKIIGIIFIFIIINKILQFFGIELSSYLVYMFWFIAIVLFYFILPKDYLLFK